MTVAPPDVEIYRAEGLTRHYRRARGAAPVRAVDGIDLDVTEGMRLGVVGESGSGKSTLLRMLAALERPTSGTLRFAGTAIGGLPESSLGFLRREVQVVFQDPRSSLDPRMRVDRIVAEPLRSRFLRRRDGRPHDPVARVAEVLDEVGLPPDAARRYPHEFSGGQRQRIAIARALAPRPRVLLADEPVSAVDVSVRAQILNLLRDLVDAHGLTMVFVTHDLEVVRHVCDAVIVMRAGRIVERGPVAEVYARPRDAYTQELLAAIPRLPR